MEFNAILSGITNTNGKFAQEAQDRLDSLTKPQGSLGRLEEFAKQLVAITGELMPSLDKKVVFT
ncbi:MAG: nicotinate-nucleotide--dimethylbenzimidazole phosphoribosyltransferase, partial [Nitrospirota bacterium]|nr:nicotinate-nucleotide--dimethylbenzimidazole phosphoribosyltransferase [Nitrospirota bacterium]